MTEPEARGLYQQGEEAVVGWMLATDQRLRTLEEIIKALQVGKDCLYILCSYVR